MSTNPRAGNRLVIGGPPRAELLPPEFAAEARLRAQRRGMVGIAILAVVVVGLAYGYVTLRSTVSAQLLASANAETTSLISQQQDYAQVGIVNGQLAILRFLDRLLPLVRQKDPDGRIPGIGQLPVHPTDRQIHQAEGTVRKAHGQPARVIAERQPVWDRSILPREAEQ